MNHIILAEQAIHVHVVDINFIRLSGTTKLFMLYVAGLLVYA